MQLYDSRAQALRDFTPLVPGRVGMYVCGPTVQSSPHIGHLRSALVYGLEVQVDLVEELGADGYLYGHAEVDGKRTDLVARVDGRTHAHAGEKVFLIPTPRHLHVFDTESGLRLNAAVSAD